MDPHDATVSGTPKEHRRRWRDLPNSSQVQWMLGTTGKVIRAACTLAIVIGAVCAVYLTDRRSSNLETIPWLPRLLHGLAHWADYHGRFRNVPAYALLSVPVLILCTTARKRRLGVAGLAAFATFMEFTQLFIPTRFFDWFDILESWLGIVIIWVLVESAYLVSRSAHRMTAHKEPVPDQAHGRPPASDAPRRLPVPRPAHE
jgi:hypothetical protein